MAAHEEKIDMEKQTPAPPSTSQGVHLTIGTLIVIALIVTMCSGKSEVAKIRQDTAAMSHQVGEINRKLDTLIEKQGRASAPDVEAASTPPGAGTTTTQNP